MYGVCSAPVADGRLRDSWGTLRDPTVLRRSSSVLLALRPAGPDAAKQSAALLRPSTRRHLLPKGALRAAGRPLARNSPDRGLLLVENNPTVGSPPRKTGQLPQEGVKREQRQRRCRKSRADGLKDVGDAQTPLEHQV
ncbi:hypothetical protein MTP99_015019 [Tenebrio molitor]|nr:hypothetical protein MTP99_015019 [Tenebrio molitor]